MKNPIGLTGMMLILVGGICLVMVKTANPESLSPVVRHGMFLLPVGAALFFLSVVMKKIKAGSNTDKSIDDEIQKFQDEDEK